MVIRLLLAVLMVAGPVPVRVCTCAAASPITNADSAVPVPPGSAAKHCRCGHHPSAPAEASADPDDSMGHCDACSVSGRQPAHDQHERDCPSLNPRPAPQAVQTPVTDRPAEGCASLPVRLDAPRSARPAAVPSHLSRAGRSAVPLYLSLLSIRI